jgi:hypothetical protein
MVANRRLDGGADGGQLDVQTAVLKFSVGAKPGRDQLASTDTFCAVRDLPPTVIGFQQLKNGLPAYGPT